MSIMWEIEDQVARRYELGGEPDLLIIGIDRYHQLLIKWNSIGSNINTIVTSCGNLTVRIDKLNRDRLFVCDNDLQATLQRLGIQ